MYDNIKRRGRKLWFDFSIVCHQISRGEGREKQIGNSTANRAPFLPPLFPEYSKNSSDGVFFYDNVMTDLLFFPTLYWSFVSSYGQGDNHWVFPSPILSADKGPVTSENERPGLRGRQSTTTPLLATSSYRMGRRAVEGSNALRPRAHSASLVRQTRIFC